MLCQNCQKRDATCYISIQSGGTFTESAVCDECFEIQTPDVKEKASAARAAHCEYCGGRPCLSCFDFFGSVMGSPKTKFMCYDCSEAFAGYAMQEMDRPFPKVSGGSPQDGFMVMRSTIDKYMAQWVAAAANRAKLAEMVQKPPLLPDPVFPKASYLQDFSMHFFTQLLAGWKKPELVREITPFGNNCQMAALRVGLIGFWAFDFDVTLNGGVSGRDEFLNRVKDPIRRPPAHMASFTSEQHILTQGVIKIQTAEKPLLVPPMPGGYELVMLKTIGWYAAQIVPSHIANQQRNNLQEPTAITPFAPPPRTTSFVQRWLRFLRKPYELVTFFKH
jgi:hypothetical protein